MQFGTALHCILQHIAYCNPKFGPPSLAKIDLADGYYRVALGASAMLTLAVVLPLDGNAEPLLGIPLSLPMGWCESPPFFCMFTETCADLTNQGDPLHPMHPFQIPPPDPEPDNFHKDIILPYNPNPPPTPLHFTDVYLDNFMIVAQQPYHMPTINSLLYNLHSIFKDANDSPR